MRIDAKQKKKFIQTVCIALAVIAVIIVAAVVIPSVLKGLDGSSEAELPEGYVTYNASRYFFRFDYPETWRVETDSSGFGFMQEPEKGLVVTLVPAVKSGSTGENNTADSAADAEDTSESAEHKYAEGITERFYYRDFSDGKKLDSKAAFDAFSSEISEGLLCSSGEQLVSSNVSTQVQYVGSNEIFYRADITYTVSSETVNDAGEKITAEKTYKGEMFVCARSMAYCAVVVSYDSENELQYKEFKKELADAADSFRFSVFDD